MSKTMWMLALRNVTRNKRRTFLSLIAIAIAALSIVLLLAVVEGMKIDLKKNLTDYYIGEVRIRNAQYNRYERYHPLHLSVDQSIVETLKHTPLVTSYSQRVTFPSLLYKEEKTYSSVGIGIDMDKESSYADFSSIISKGRLPNVGSFEIVMGSQLAQNLNLDVGDTITTLSTTANRASNAATWSIVGLVSFPVGSMNNSYFLAPLDTVQHFLSMEGKVQEILLKVEGDEIVAAQELTTLFHNPSLVVEPFQHIQQLYELLELSEKIYYLISLFFVILASTVVINTTMMMVFERTQELGTLRALGLRPQKVHTLLSLEGLILNTTGSLIGALIGTLIALVLTHTGIDFTEALSGVDMEVSSIIYPVVYLKHIVFSWLFTLLISTGAIIISTRKVTHKGITESLRYV
ncbi:MAG: ABC transporter permease [Sphaerochaetaceae bacterium]|jgi:putative ABC transport system permease protein